MLFQFNNVEISASGFGTDIRIKYLTNLNNYKEVLVTVTSDFEVNVAAIGTLNKAGQQALKDAILLAEILISNK